MLRKNKETQRRTAPSVLNESQTPKPFTIALGIPLNLWTKWNIYQPFELRKSQERMDIFSFAFARRVYLGILIILWCKESTCFLLTTFIHPNLGPSNLQQIANIAAIAELLFLILLDTVIAERWGVQGAGDPLAFVWGLLWILIPALRLVRTQILEGRCLNYGGRVW